MGVTCNARLCSVVGGFGWFWVVLSVGIKRLTDKWDARKAKCRLLGLWWSCGGFFVLGGITIPENQNAVCTVNFSRVGQPMERERRKTPTDWSWGCFVVCSFGL